MYARVAAFEGDPSQADQAIQSVREEVESDSPPPGLENSKGMMMFVDRQSGKGSELPFTRPRTTCAGGTRP